MADLYARTQLVDGEMHDPGILSTGGHRVLLRPARVADDEFLYALLKAALGPYVVQTFGPWDDRAQREQFFAAADLDLNQIVAWDGQPVGCLKVQCLPEAVMLYRVFVLPEYQGRGLGTYLVRRVLAEGQANRLPVRLRVLRVNPARRLYERLGFVITGQTKTHYLMECPAPAVPPPSVAS